MFGANPHFRKNKKIKIEKIILGTETQIFRKKIKFQISKNKTRKTKIEILKTKKRHRGVFAENIWLFKIKFVPLWRVFHGYIKLFSTAVIVRCWRFFFMRVRVRA